MLSIGDFVVVVVVVDDDDDDDNDDDDFGGGGGSSLCYSLESDASGVLDTNGDVYSSIIAIFNSADSTDFAVYMALFADEVIHSIQLL